VTQRVVRHAALALDPRGGGGAAAGYAHARLPLFQPLPESQPVLPCLLRRLLQQARAGALRGAARGALPAARPVPHRVGCVIDSVNSRGSHRRPPVRLREAACAASPCRAGGRARLSGAGHCVRTCDLQTRHHERGGDRARARARAQGRVAEAATLARRHSQAPHFARSLEWLLFTALEVNADAAPPPPPDGRGGQGGAAGAAARRRRADVAGPLLLAAAGLIRQFPQARARRAG